jgi:hypothetical protein
MLKLNPDWEHESPGPISPAVSASFLQIINRISSKAPYAKRVYEFFKPYFASAAGEAYSSSSDTGWAATDLARHMDSAATNAPLFIDAFCTACEKLHAANPDLPVPDIKRINRILAEHDAGYQIRDSVLVATRAHEPIEIPQETHSLDEQANAIIQQAIATSNKALDRGDGRQAVQELLWLLETITTAFRGANTASGTIEGKYFNKIVTELRADRHGGHRKQILDWLMALHGFLSSPTGGGVRHGVDLREGVAVQINEARFYCNLIRSHIAYLIEEYERLGS